MKLYLPLSIFLALWGRMDADCSLADFQAISRIDFSDFVAWMATEFADTHSSESYVYFHNYVTSRWIAISAVCSYGYIRDPERDARGACNSVCSAGPSSAVCRTCWASSALPPLRDSNYLTSASSCSLSEIQVFGSLSVSTLNACTSGQSPDMSTCLAGALNSMSKGSCTDCLGNAFTALSANCDALCGGGDATQCQFCSLYAGMVAAAQCAYPDCSLSNTCSYSTCSPADLSAIGAIDLLAYSNCLLNTFADSTAVSACVDELAATTVTPGCVDSLVGSVAGIAASCTGLCDGTLNDARCLACYVGRAGYLLGGHGYNDLPGVCHDVGSYGGFAVNQIPTACASVTSGVAAGYCAATAFPNPVPACSGCTSAFVAKAYDKCETFCSTLTAGQEAYCTACIQQTSIAAFALCSSTLRGLPLTMPSCSASEVEDLGSTDFASALACIDATSASDPVNLATCLSAHMSVIGGSILSSCVDGLILSMAGYAPGFCVNFCRGSLSSSSCLACMVSQTGIPALQALAGHTGATQCTSTELENLIEAGLIGGLTTSCYYINSMTVCLNRLKGPISEGCTNALESFLISAQTSITSSGPASGCTSFGPTDGDALMECLTLASLIGPIALASTGPTGTTTTITSVVPMFASYFEQFGDISIGAVTSGNINHHLIAAAQSIIASLPAHLRTYFSSIAVASAASDLTESDIRNLQLLVGAVAVSRNSETGQSIAEIIAGESLTTLQTNLGAMIDATPVLSSEAVSAIANLVSQNVASSDTMSSVSKVLVGAPTIGPAAAYSLLQLATGNHKGASIYLDNLQAILAATDLSTIEAISAFAVIAGKDTSNKVLACLYSVASSVPMGTKAVASVASALRSGPSLSTKTLLTALSGVPISRYIPAVVLESILTSVVDKFDINSDRNTKEAVVAPVSWLLLAAE